MKTFAYVEIIFSIFLISSKVGASEKPNVVIILADDLGYNDVSFHGSSEILTPNIDALCYSGLILNRFYALPLCTPSRSSLLTAKYSTKLGMQHFVIPSDEPWGLGLNEKLMPEYFKEAGYKTALVGKWHLGFYKKKYTPTQRGFDTHYGYLGPYIGYYNHSLIMLDRTYARGYDFRNNLESINSSSGYATELFTNEAVKLIRNKQNYKPLFMLVSHLSPHAGNENEPMEAPQDAVSKFSYIKSEKRRKLAGMISVLDDGVGKIISALKEKNILNNTIVMFLSDNGGPHLGVHSTEASNYPLRGQKGSVWEGGTRVPACVYSPLISSQNKVVNDLMHITDIFPSFASAANIKITDNSLDGIDQWKTIKNGEITIRNEILYNIESEARYSAILNKEFKLVNGTDNIEYATWLGSNGNDAVLTFDQYVESIQQSEAGKSLPKLSVEKIMKLRSEATTRCNKTESAVKCDPLVSPCLFNIFDDPCEENNLAEKYPEKVEYLLSRLQYHELQMVATRRRKPDPNCDPKNFNFTWTWWTENESDAVSYTHEKDYILVALGILIICVFGFLIWRKVKTVKNGPIYTLAVNENI